MKIIICYICVSNGSRSPEFAHRFLRTYESFPAGIEHEIVIVFNGGEARRSLRQIFNRIPHGYHERSNEGWDIGAYQDVASRVDPDLLVCFGESTYFHRAGWLRRLAEAGARFGHGMYGCFSSGLVSPHLNTTSFACSPGLIRSYPIKCKNRKDRYEFEHGRNPLWRRVAARGFPVKLVTWDGEWDHHEWRTPPNILWRGDQSNCLVFCNHTDKWASSSEETRERWSAGADGVAVARKPEPTAMA